MSLFGTLDVLVYFRNFRNIDLYHQGIYYIRAQVAVPEQDSASMAQLSASSERLAAQGEAGTLPSQSSSSSSSAKVSREEAGEAREAGEAGEPKSPYALPYSTMPLRSATLISSSSSACQRATRGSRDATQKQRKKEAMKAQSEPDAPDPSDVALLKNPQPSTPTVQMGVPHQFFSSPDRLTSLARGNFVEDSDALGAPACILDAENAFCTRHILVRYIEEEFCLNDACVFRIEVPLDPDSLTVARLGRMANPFLSMDLMWIDVREDEEGKPIGREPAHGEHISVARSVVELNCPEYGLHTYTPVLFDDTHFVQIDTLVHCCMHTIRFLPRPGSLAMRATLNADGGVDSSSTKQVLLPPHELSTSNNNSSATSASNVLDLAMQEVAFDSSSTAPQRSKRAATTMSEVVFPPPSSVAPSDYQAYFSRSSPEHAKAADDTHRKYIHWMLDNHKRLIGFIRSSIVPQLQTMGQEKMKTLQNLMDMTGFHIDAEYLSEKESEDAELNHETEDGLESKLIKANVSWQKQMYMDTCKLRDQPVSTRVSKYAPDALTCALQQDMNMVSVTVMLLWHQLIECLCDVRVATKVCEVLRCDWELNAQLRARESIFTEVVAVSPQLQMKKDSAKVYEVAANNLRKDRSFIFAKHALGAEDEQLFGRRADLPICFTIKHMNYPSNAPSKTLNTVECEKAGGTHLIVFQHGYQGSTYDLRLFRDMIAFLFRSGSEDTKRERERLFHRSHPPRRFAFLIAVSNEKRTDGNIEIMGQRLAKEVHKKIGDINKSESPLTRLSFVGHSLGSVIVRSALSTPDLKPYLQKLHTFISLTSPHLGFFYAPGIVNTAVWLLRRFQKSLALEQLSLSDHSDVRKSFIYKLSTKSLPLSHFKYVILVGSHQDNYAPYHSARIEMARHTDGPYLQSETVNLGLPPDDPRLVLHEMVSNIMKHIAPEKLVRINVDFHLDGSSKIDTTIGRAAHIRFLDSFQLTFNLLMDHRHCFDWE